MFTEFGRFYLVLSLLFWPVLFASAHADDCHTNLNFPSQNITSLSNTALDLDHEFQIAGGSTGAGGGGSGIACFKFKADADKAKKARAAHLPLPRELVTRLTSLQTLEYWEHKGDTVFVEPEPRRENAATYLKRVLGTYLRPIAPSFDVQVGNALDRVSLDYEETADETGKLKQIDDTGSIASGEFDSSAYGHCALVQIAVRYAEKGQDGKIKTVVGLDRDLYALLGLDRGKLSDKIQIINQALLRLHEALYLLGYGLGQKTSERVRLLGILLSSQDVYDGFSQRQPNPRFPSIPKAAMIHLLFQVGFGDFPFFEHPSGPDSNELLHQAYLRYESRYINEIMPYAASSDVNSRIALLWSELSEPEAFIALAEIALSRGANIDLYSLAGPKPIPLETLTTTCAAEMTLIREMSRSIPITPAEKEAAQFVPAFSKKIRNWSAARSELLGEILARGWTSSSALP
jgi:hypothetical protein